MVAINSAIEVDVTGQVLCRFYWSKNVFWCWWANGFYSGCFFKSGGKAIIALPSITNRGESRIVPYLKQGAGVVSTRSHVQYIITENGIADLYGKTLKQRAVEMVKLHIPIIKNGLKRNIIIW
jgi:acyl-CoA hydrolase